MKKEWGRFFTGSILPRSTNYLDSRIATKPGHSFSKEEGSTDANLDLWLATKGQEMERRRNRVAEICAKWGEKAREVTNLDI